MWNVTHQKKPENFVYSLDSYLLKGNAILEGKCIFEPV